MIADLLEHLRGWLGGALVVSGVAAPFIWRWVQREIPKRLLAYLGPRLLEAVQGGGVPDEALRRWVRQVTFATVLLAEAKFPDRGMGREKFDLAFNLLGSYMPWLDGFLRQNGDDLAALINASVAEMDAEFKRLLEANSTEKDILMLPETPKHRIEPRN